MALLAFYAFAVGAVVGSFLNVVIHRYPREESIVFPPSHCPNCGYQIRPWDNIPLVSWLVLRGRCRNCREPISIRYPLVELSNALLYLALFQRTGPAFAFVPLAAFLSMMIVLVYIDLDIQILPDVITYPGIALGLLASWLMLFAGHSGLVLAEDWIDSLAGAVLGASILTAIILTYWLIRRVEGMGWGDVKMIAMIGAFLGWRAVPGVLLLASVAGAFIGVPVALRSEKRMQVALPFGVFLGLASLAILFFGHTLFEWWMRLLVLP